MITPWTAPARRRTAVGLSAALVAGLLAAGCGGAGHRSSGDAGAGAELAVIRLHGPDVSVRGGPRPAGAGTAGAVSTGRVVSRARFPGGREAEEGSGGAKAVRPCSLVTRSEAAAITGRRIVRMVEAPQGPTCIYEPQGVRTYITMSVQRGSFARMRRHMRVIGRRSVAGRPTYCVRFGGVSTYVTLPAGRLLHVVAPCAVGTRFAARALSRLHP